jgi:glycosyltransferase involved in cell wall biosynthesis
LRRDDVIICLTDPPFAGIVATLLAQLKGASVIHWVQDIYPETATSLGFGSPSNPLIRLVAGLRDWAWSKAVINVVIGEHMLAMLQKHGVEARQVKVIQNWADDAQLVPLDLDANPLRQQWGFDDRTFVIGYSGNLGRAHDAETMLEAARLLAKDADGSLRFLFIGGGAKHALLQSAMAEQPLAGMIARQAYRPRAELSQSLNVPDVHWLSLEPELEGLIVPSKFYGAAAVGRPIIFIGDTEGEIAKLIRKADCGASFAKGDAKGVADFISALRKDPSLRRQLGDNARAYCVAQLSRAKRLSEWRALIEYLAALRKLGSH